MPCRVREGETCPTGLGRNMARSVRERGTWFGREVR